MTVMQIIFEEGAGETQDFLNGVDFSKCKSQTSDLKMPSSYIQVFPRYFKKQKLVAPVKDVELSLYNDDSLYVTHTIPSHVYWNVKYVSSI